MNFLSLDIYAGTYRDFLEKIRNPEKKTLVFTPNPEILLRASEDESFLDMLKEADYLTPDGVGLYVASLIREGSSYLRACRESVFSRKNLEEKYGERIRGSDLTRDLIEGRVEQQDTHILIIDRRVIEVKSIFDEKKKELQQNAKSLLESRYPGLIVHLVYVGEMSAHEMAHMIEREDIRYVFSCIGMRSQEEILVEIFSSLPENQRVVGLGVGSSIDYLLGLQTRAPIILQRLGLEWLYRLMLAPRARWHRIVDAVWRFPMTIGKKSEKSSGIFSDFR